MSRRRRQLVALLLLLVLLVVAVPILAGARRLLVPAPAEDGAIMQNVAPARDSATAPGQVAAEVPTLDEHSPPAPGEKIPSEAATTVAANANEQVALAYTIDRSTAPPLPYEELTLLVEVGRVGDLRIRGDGAALDYHYDAETGLARITTAASQLDLVLYNPLGSVTGNIRIAPLKDNYQWAWSHGFDDNVNLRPAIDLFRQYSWRATLFLIARDVEDARDEAWIVDAPLLLQLLEEGWSLGNHTWDHSCSEDTSGATTVTRAHERLEEIVARSARPHYPIIAFAAPCFSPAYDDILASLQAAGDTSLLFNESGNNYYLAITPGAVEYTEGARQILPFASGLTIGRSPAVELGTDEATKEFDWVAAQAAAGRPLWFNTFSHGDKENTLAAVLAYLYTMYGPGGSDTLWVAPSDEIYSYLLLREKAVISRR